MTRRKILALRKKLYKIVKENPGVNPENAWHVLMLLEEKPIERLRRGLMRAQKPDFRR